MRQRGGSEQPVKGRRANRPKALTKAHTIAAPSIADLQKQVGALTRELKEAREEQAATASQRSSAADLRKQLDQRTRELRHTRKLLTEALQQQTATGDVLKVISRSAFDLQTVLDALLGSACRLCEADIGTIRYRDGSDYRLGATFGCKPEWIDHFSRYSTKPDRGSIFGRTIVNGCTTHIPDVLADADWQRQRAQKLMGFRAALGAPLARDRQTFGVISLFRLVAGSFSKKQIELLETFADQAVIAIENARLFNETQKGLERQTATSDILRVIASSPSDVQPVFDAIAESAKRLLGSYTAVVTRVIDGVVHLAAGTAANEAAAHAVQGMLPYPLSSERIHARVARTGELAVNTDVDASSTPQSVKDLARTIGWRSLLVVPMLRNGIAIGTIGITRREAGSFDEKTIDLLKTFADQAVIAIENARLFNETKEALERQTATGEVLQVINSSQGDLAPVFETILEKAHSICGVSHGSLQLYDGEKFRAVAVHGIAEAFADRLRQGFVPGPGHPSQPLLEGARFAQVPDCAAIDDPIVRAAFELGGIRTVLFIPLRKEGSLLGQIAAARRDVNPFTEKEIALLENFAAQAVIAMENARLLTETREALERQTATAEVLQVINSSQGDLTPVFDAILEKAHSLCAVAHGTLQLYDGEAFRGVASRGLPETFAAHLRQGVVPSPNTPHRRLLEGARFAQVTNWAEIDNPVARAALDAGIRTTLYIPLRRERKLLGYIAAARQEVRPFVEKEIALLESFAAQAVIAMDNARLLDEVRHRNNELAEALEFQTATGEVLRIVASSPEKLQPVFDAMLEKAIALCNAKFGTLFLYDGKTFSIVADRNLPPEYARLLRGKSFLPEANSGFRHLVESKAPLHLTDMFADSSYARGEPLRVAAVELGGVRSFAAVPLLRKGELIGNFSIYRGEPGGFAENQIALVTTFADQAVIAIENARLLAELRERQAELARSVDELTATGDVLKVISRSTVDLETVLDTLCETVARLCRADQAPLYRRRDDKHHLVAAWGMPEEARQFALAHPLTADRGSLTGRVILERRAIHIPDVFRDPEYTYSEGQKAIGYRTLLGIPLLREDALIGIFAISRTRVEPFTDKEIELASSFADQAVIAIENARLFEELQERQAELRVTFDNMGDGVVMFGADTRLVAWNRNFQEILDLPDAFLAQRPNYADYFGYLAERGEYSADLEEELSRTIGDTSRELRLERTRPDGRVIEVRRNPVPGGGFVLIFADITERKRAEEATRSARDAAEKALRELQTAQASLVHAQKMAALGQVTAGIAHEIKNPLNFVNNFAGLSVELLDELKDAAAKAVGAIDPGKRDEIVETIGMLTGNLQKIVEHGRRADGIVRSMLQHSRGSSDDRQPIDLNALAEEALNLAYHGARAQDPNFDIALEHDLDSNLAPVDAVPQELTRVLLNLIGNGFYAANMRSRESDGTYRPALKVTTREFGESVEVRVRDNGVGVPPENRDKLFQPFFTTKPTGEGTGLGLSISYEIVTQQHGGTISVESEVGDFTEFTVRLPRSRHAQLDQLAIR